jgi:PAS domain S-box-containing protein
LSHSSAPAPGIRHRELSARLTRSGRWSLVLAAIVAAAGLVGHANGIGALAEVFPGWPAVTPAAAVGTIGLAAACALLLWARQVAGQLVLAALALACLCAMLLPDAAGLPGGALPAYPGSVLMLLIAAAALSGAPGGRQRPAVRLLAAASAALLLIALIGISFRLLLALPPLVQISLPIVVALLLLTYALVAIGPEAWLLDQLASERPGVVITRRLLPTAVLLPLAIGWIVLALEGAGILDSAIGSVLQAVVTLVALGALVLWGARRLDRIDARRSAAEHDAHAQREWLHVTIASCGEAVVATDPGGVVRLVNRAAELLVGRSAGELVGRPVAEAFPLSVDAAHVEHPLVAVLRGTEPPIHQEFTLAQGALQKRVEVNAAPIRGDEDALLGGVMIVRDVSLRHQHEQALRHAYAELDRRVAERTAALERANTALHESLALLRGVAESTPDLIMVKDGFGRVMMANPAQVKAIGKPEAEIVGRTEREFTPDAELARRTMEHDRRVMASGRVERTEESVPRPDGIRTYLATRSPLRDVRGNVIGVIGVSTDISERKRMETELREAQRFTLGLVETAPIVLYLFDYLQQRIVYAAGMGLHALGYTAGELMAHDRARLEELVHPDDLPKLTEGLRERQQGDGAMREVEFRCRTKSGEWRWMHGRERPFEPGAHNRPLLLGVTVDITERKIAELEREQLMAAEQKLRREAERANRAKDEFLAIVSHELRSPLNALRGWGYLLGSAKAPDASLIERATQAIKRNVDQQARLIDDLLDTSRIMSGKLNIERRPLDLVEVVQAAIEVVRASADAKRITLEFRSARDAVALEGDAARLNQVVVNLLTNAVKFTPEDGKVKVALDLDRGTARLSVADTGAGIDPEFLPHVFDRFSQADTSSTRRHGGLGIGLALVRNLTELHGGRVSAHSDGPGKGSTFTVELPLPPAVAQPAGAIASDVQAVGGLAGVRICTLDDDPDARDVITLTLSQAGADVRTVTTGAELVEALQRDLPASRPDVLLMDLAMPDEDGFTVLARVRALESQKGIAGDAAIPAIAVTAFTEMSRARVLERGFVDHVSKPIDPAKLVASIRRAIDAEARAEL